MCRYFHTNIVARQLNRETTTKLKQYNEFKLLGKESYSMYRILARVRHSGMLFPPDKNKSTVTISEPNLKQVSLNTDQNNGHWPIPKIPRKKMASNYVSEVLIKAKPTICTFRTSIHPNVLYTKAPPTYM